MAEAKDLTFLVVDDNETVRTIMPRFLKNNFPGCAVVTAESFEDAQIAIRANPAINYIVSDFQIGEDRVGMGESLSCGAFLKDAVEYKRHAGIGSKPLLGVAVHTSMKMLNPTRDLSAYHSLSEKARAARDCGMKPLELEKFGDWDEKCQIIKDHIAGRERPATSISR